MKKAENGVGSGERTNEAFAADRRGSAAKVADLVAEIAAASNEQAQGIDQVNTAVGQMDKVTQQNAANAERVGLAPPRS